MATGFMRSNTRLPDGALRAQVFKGLSPWGYAPAYMIHDWGRTLLKFALSRTKGMGIRNRYFYSHSHRWMHFGRLSEARDGRFVWKLVRHVGR